MSMMPRFRLLPFTMAFLSILFVIKAGDAVRGGQELTQALLVGEVIAEEPAEAKKDEAAAEKDAQPEEKKEEKTAENGGDKKEGDMKAEGDKKEGAKEEKKDAAAEEMKDKDKKQYTQIELDLLQNLSQRREQIEQWAKEVEMKENLLAATEKRVDEKLATMASLKKEVEGLLAQYNTQEDTQIKSLVKIYENMKPKDAARIFDEMEMPILLLVVDRMSERKVAPILANMAPKKAKDVTEELAEQRRLRNYTEQSLSETAAP